MREIEFIKPSWPAPANVKTLQTTRIGGFSQAPYASLNLGMHVGDDVSVVVENRKLLCAYLPSEPVWVNQVHGIDIIDAAKNSGLQNADASFTTQANIVCVTMTADCLPVLLCDKAGTVISAVHAGWRGLAGDGARGVVEVLAETAQSQGLRVADCLVWLGPCIGPEAFEVGADVQTAFCSATANASLEACFRPKSVGKFQADLAHLARLRLAEVGFEKIYGNDSSPPWCTVSQPSRYFSHRRDAARLGGTTGRMAAGVWLV